jgi:hypothetical protein
MTISGPTYLFGKEKRVSNFLDGRKYPAQWNYLLCWLVPLIVYAFNALFIYPCPYATYPYYNYLWDSLFHGRLDIDSPHLHDLSKFQGKYYLYWGPAPLIYVLPFYLLFGINTSDIAYNLLAAIANVVVFALVLEKMVAYFHIEASPISRLFLILNFCLASPNFFLSVRATIWYVAQIIATLYLLLSIYSCFRFLEKPQRNFWWLWSVFFMNCAWFSRIGYCFYMLILLFPLIVISRENQRFPWPKVLSGAIITCAFVVTALTYNYLRFGNPFESGLLYQIATESVQSNGPVHTVALSLSYIPQNFVEYFLKPFYFRFGTPHTTFTPWGNSAFSVYPSILFLLFWIGKGKSLAHPAKIFLLLTGLACLMEMFLLLCFDANGWMQFGSRYFLAIMIVALLFISFRAQKIPLWLNIVVLTYGYLVNQVGCLLYYRKILF